MSAGGYESPNGPSSFSSYGSRRTSGLASGSYDRTSNGTTRRASPSPGSSRRFPSFDRPSRGGSSYQGEYPNSYRANSYRPDYGNNNYYSRSPSPDRYATPRSAESDSWERPGQWQSTVKSSSWQERKAVPLSPPSSISRGRSRSGDDMMATRMFEPSDTWKQTHVNRPPRGDSYRPGNPDHRYDYRSRLDASPERSRSDSSNFFTPGGDRYRPAPPKWDSHSISRSEYNSYRSGGSSWTPPSREPLSPSGSYRRDSLSASHSRLSDHYGPSYNDRRVSSGSAAGSVSPHPRARSPPDRLGRLGRSSSRDRSYYSAYDSDSSNNRRYDVDDRSRKRKHSRSTSRSSIASTQHSANTNPPLSVSRPDPTLPDLGRNGTRGSSVHSVFSQSAVPKTAGVLNAQSTIDAIKSKTGNLFDSPNLAGKPLKLNGPLLNEVVPSAKTSLPTSKPTVSEIPQASSSWTNGKTNQNISAHVLSKSNFIDTRQFTSSFPNTPTHSSTISPDTQQSATAATSAPSHSVLPSLNSGSSQSSVKLIPDPKVDITRSTSVAPMLVDDSPSVPSRVSLPPLRSDADISPIVDSNIPIDSMTAVDEGSSLTPGQSETKSSPLPTELPKLSEARSLKEALRAVVMTRLLCDRQSREERVEPILAANLSITTKPEVDTDSNPDQVVQEVYSIPHIDKRLRVFQDIKPVIVEHFRKRQDLITMKAEGLKEEYICLQQTWNAHRSALNQQSKALAAEQEQVHHTGRTTRRTANLGDAVRSDLEMEQIIASLGYDEATDPSILCLRNVATIPDMISVTHGKIDYYFDDTNNRVDNPSEYYAPETGLHDWTEEERDIFISKFAAHPKQFGIIADFLPNKTPAQCVAFYYLHKHKHIDFRKVVSTLGPNKRRRRGGGKKKSNALLTDIAQHDEQVGRDNAASPAGGRPKRGRKPNSEKPVSTRKPASAITSALEETPTATPTPEPDAKPKRGRGRPPGSGKKAAAAAAAAAAMATISTVDTPVTTDVPLDTPATTPALVLPTLSSNRESPQEEADQEPKDVDGQPIKRIKRVRKVKSAAIINDDEVGTSATDSPAPSAAPTPGADVSSPMDADANPRTKRAAPTASTASPSTEWSEEDKMLFLTLLAQHGTDFKRIAASMANQTSVQIRTYYKRNREELGLEKIASRAAKRSKSPAEPSTTTSTSVPTLTSATSAKSSERFPLPSKPRTNGTSSTITEPKGKFKEDDPPPMASLTPPPSVAASTSNSSQESKMPEILKGWGSIMSRERPPPPPPRHPPKPKQSSRRPQSMSEVHSPTSSPPQPHASLPSASVTSPFLPTVASVLPTSLPPRPTSVLPAKPSTSTTQSSVINRHYPTANYTSASSTSSSSSTVNSSNKAIPSATPMAATGATAGGKAPAMPLTRAPRTTAATGTTPYQASAPRYPPVYGPPPPPRPPFTATPSGSGTGTTGQKDGHPHYPIYPPGGPYYYPSTS